VPLLFRAAIDARFLAVSFALSERLLLFPWNEADALDFRDRTLVAFGTMFSVVLSGEASVDVLKS
jgi:hypothetical protein